MRNFLAVVLVLLGVPALHAQQPIYRVRVVLALATASQTRQGCACPGGQGCSCSYCEGQGTCACGAACVCPTPRTTVAKSATAPVRVLRMVPAAQYYRGLPATGGSCVGGR